MVSVAGREMVGRCISLHRSGGREVAPAKIPSFVCVGSLEPDLS